MFALKLYLETTRMIIAVVNQKGGTGKTTVATHWCGIENSHSVPTELPQSTSFNTLNIKIHLTTKVACFNVCFKTLFGDDADDHRGGQSERWHRQNDGCDQSGDPLRRQRHGRALD